MGRGGSESLREGDQSPSPLRQGVEGISVDRRRRDSFGARSQAQGGSKISLMRIVVDASVLVATLMADGAVRDVLLSSPDHEYIAPRYIQVELERNLSRIAARARLPMETVRALTEDVLGAVDLIQPGAYGHLLADATASAKAAHAQGDEDSIAVALLLSAPVWTLDNNFRRVKGIRCLNTKEVSDLTL